MNSRARSRDPSGRVMHLRQIKRDELLSVLSVARVGIFSGSEIASFDDKVRRGASALRGGNLKKYGQQDAGTEKLFKFTDETRKRLILKR